MGTPTKTYARSRGVDPAAVRRGIREGLIAVDDNGQIADVAQADSAWLSTRRGPQLGLTVEGHTLIEYADRMLDTAGEIVDRFRSRDPLKGTLRLGLSESFALICLTDLLKRGDGAVECLAQLEGLVGSENLDHDLRCLSAAS